MVLAIGTLYYSHSTSRGEATFTSIPFYDASIEWNKTEASTMSFKSPVKLAEADRIRYEATDTRRNFGGQVTKVKATAKDDYEYEVISYLRLYHSKITFSCKNMTASKIMKKILKKDANKLSTAGITETSIIHGKLKWVNTSIWDIANQLCYLEHKFGNDIGCHIDENGTMRFGYSLNNQEGYVFTNVLDYSEEYDSSDFITQYSVTYNGKVVASSSANQSLIAKWGVISEVEDCTTSTSTSSSAGKTATTTTDANAEANIKKWNIESKIVKQAQSITSGKKSDKAKAKAIWKWMRSNIKYSYYACTRKNALGTLKARAGNCADQTHLYMCLALASGLTVRCNHINGHFFPQTKIDGKWFDTDTVTRRGWGGHWGNGGHWAYHYDPHKFNC